MADSARGRLLDLLLRCFNREAAFKAYCAEDPWVADHVRSLPEGASLIHVVLDTVDFLLAHNLVYEFLERLHTKRPMYSGEIRVVAREWRPIEVSRPGWLGVTSGSHTRNHEPRDEIFLNVWFPAYEPREPRLIVDQPIDMSVDLGPQRLAARRGSSPVDPATREALLNLPGVDVWVQCADASVTPCDGTLVMPWPTNVLTFTVTPRVVGSLRIVVVLLVRNHPIHRLQRELQVFGRRAEVG